MHGPDLVWRGWALRCLQLFMNRLQYAMTLMSLFSLENRCVMSSGVGRHARCTFLISRLSVGVVISVIGKLNGSCESQCGPFYQGVDVDIVVGSIRLEMRSPGLE